MEKVITEILQLEATGDDGSGFRIEFVWTGDRYRHLIYTVHQGVSSPVLTSVEGDDQSNWPPSPPLQQVSIEEVDGNPAAFGVGMAGKSHFSAAYLIQLQPRPTLVCDLAVLAKEVPHYVGSQYLVESVDENDKGLQIAFADGLLQLVGNVRRNWVDAAGVNSNEQAMRQLELLPESETLEAGTIQWKFRLELQEHKRPAE